MTLKVRGATERIAGMENIELPPLPAPGFDITNDRRMPTRVVSIADHGVYSAEQMRDYAAQSVIRERERGGKVERCESCRFLGGVGQYYDCRRNAPITFREFGGVLRAQWPQVEEHQSCGDYERKQSR